MTTKLPTLYQEFIHLSRYARWIEDEKRRETWKETVDRYVNHMCDVQCEGMVPDDIKTEIREGILSLKVMPSMRCMMTAGEALERDQVAGYNCSYVAIDDQNAFDEVLYILMCGTGVGFSVERQFVNKMPVVAARLRPSKTIIGVEDSKIGWANAYRELISMLYQGRIPTWDVSAVRKAGERLKTFGGRSSGPAPLEDLFRFTIDIFKDAQGRKLSSIECHDLCCKIGEIVVVGGVRRSALISLSNPSDDRMRHAKSGDWWKSTPWRALANNSACYTEKPGMDTFMREWLSLYDSKSGERGFFNREAVVKWAEKFERRDPNHEFGCNPCVTADTWVMTEKGPMQVSSLINNPFKALVQGGLYDSNTGFIKTGHKEIFTLTTDKGYELKLTDNHKLLKGVRFSSRGKVLESEWTELKNIVQGDKILISNHREFNEWSGFGSFYEGWLIGELVGDGGYSHRKDKTTSGYVRFWGDSKTYMSTVALRLTEEVVEHRSDLSIQDNGTYEQVICVGLSELAQSYGVSLTKHLGPQLEETSSDFHKGFLRGFFDADGSVQGNIKKGVSVRLGQADLCRLKTVQRMLLRLGISSTIYEGRRAEGWYELPDGNGGLREYFCNEMHELVISGDNIVVFSDRVGFQEPQKQEKLQEIIKSYNRSPKKERFEVTVKEIVPSGMEDVYDCTVEEVHEFDANGIRAHNCSEIVLRSCGLCNLSEVVVRAEDNVEDLKHKVKLATIIGTMQATLTDFRYLRPKWRENAEDEALLGVSLTGIMDNKLMAGGEGKKKLVEVLSTLRDYAVEVNKEYAELFGINQAAAVTCVKPSGTVSQLVDCASGIHPRYSPFYIRRVRADIKDPLATLMKEMGFPCEPDVTKPENNLVFSFPVRSPENALVTEEVPSLEHLDLWKTYQLHWCEHKPSITVHLREQEWMEAGAWVYKNFDIVSGISFLPYSGHSYAQAPYQEVSEGEYVDLLGSMPEHIDWTKLSVYEKEDQTVGAKTYACSGDSCEVVDLTND